MKIKNSVYGFSGKLLLFLLVVNMAMVLAAYLIATLTGRNSASFAIVRQTFLGVSFIIVLFLNKLSVTQYSNMFVFALPLLALGMILLSEDINFSFYKIITFIIPYFYVLFSINHLSKYDYNKLFLFLLIIFLLIYSIPILVFFVAGQGLQAINIYGKEEGSFFYSNHYGWSASIVILCAYTLLNYMSFSRFIKTFLILIIIVSFYLIMISANRSSLLSIIIAGVVILLTSGSRRITNYTLFVLIPIVFYYILINIEGSALEFVKFKTQRQLDLSLEERFVVTTGMIKAFNREPSLWLTGLGMFDYGMVRDVSRLSGYHNSYWEILFGGGIFLFLIFIKIMVINPIKSAFRYFKDRAIILIPLIIIPFFESNLTGGQFLFYPWFITMLYFNLKQDYQENIYYETDTSVVQNR